MFDFGLNDIDPIGVNWNPTPDFDTLNRLNAWIISFSDILVVSGLSAVFNFYFSIDFS